MNKITLMTELYHKFITPKCAALRCLLFVILCLSATYSHSQPNIEWSRVYGGSKSEIANAVFATADNGCITTGYTLSSNSDVTNNKGKGDIWLTKLSTTGAKQWAKSIGGAGFDVAAAVQQTPDGGYIVVGHTDSSDADINLNCAKQDIVLIKLSATGNIQWTENMGGIGVDYATDLVVNTDGTYVLSGYTYSDFNNNSDMGRPDGMIVKIDATGNVLWGNTFGGASTDMFYDIEATSDGGYILSGTTMSNDGDISTNKGLFDAWIIKTNATGNLQWSKTFGGSEYDYANAITSDGANGYVFAGWTASNDGDIQTNKGGKDYWILKLNNSGTKVWSKTFGGSYHDEAKSILLTNDGGFLIGGKSNSKNGDKPNNKGNYDAWLVKTLSNGNIDWTTVYGGSNNDGLHDIIKSNDGGYFLAGFSASNNGDLNTNKGEEDFWTLRLMGTNFPTVNLGGTINLCNGEAVELSAEANCSNCSFMWNNGSTNGTLVVSPNSTTNYVVTVTNSSGVSTIDSVMVNVNTAINIGDNPTNVTCNGDSDGSILLNVNGGAGNYTYLWNNGANVPNLFNLAAGNYEVTVTDAMQCTATQAVYVSQPPAFIVNETIGETSCFGDSDGSISINVTGGNGNFNYAWSNGATTSTINNLWGGLYEVTISDNTGCDNVYEFEVTEPSVITVVADNDLVTCNGGSNGAIDLTVSGGLPPYIYSWNDGQTSEDLNNIISGVYTVLITDANQCQAIKTITIGEPVALGTFVYTTPPTNGNNGSITSTPYGGISPYTIAWSTGQSGMTITGLSAGNYTLTITDNQGCTYEETVMIGTTTVNELEVDLLELYPNPTKGLVNLRMEGGTVALSDIAIYSIDGKLLQNHTQQNLKNGLSIDLENQPKGLYLLKITNDKKSLVRKIVVQ